MIRLVIDIASGIKDLDNVAKLIEDTSGNSYKEKNRNNKNKKNE